MCFFDLFTSRAIRRNLKWYHFYFPEIAPINIENPICCGKKMEFVPTDCGEPRYVCEICMKDREVE